MPPKDIDPPIAVRKGVRSCSSRPLYPMSKFVSYKNLSRLFSAFTSHISCVEIPKTVHDALNVPEWKEAVLEEMRALEKKQKWEAEVLPKGKTTVGGKRVFTTKYNSYGTLDRYKARLVAKVTLKPMALTIRRRLHLW